MKTAHEMILESELSGGSNDFLDRLIDIMERHADQFKPKWISVKDELPDEKRDVLIVNKHAHIDTPIMIAFMFYEQFYSVLFPGKELTVTHWMPLPEKPTT